MLPSFLRGKPIGLLPALAVVILACLPTTPKVWGQTAPPPKLLTTVAQIRELPLAMQRAKLPVNLRGTVTYSAMWYGHSESAIQDATGGTYMGMRTPLDHPLQLGDTVEVVGHAEPGEWA